MIRFLSIDIDGCLNQGNRMPPNAKKIRAIRDALSKKKDRFVFTLNSGRDMTYTRYYADLLSCTMPLICENGGINYNPKTQEIIINPKIPAEYPKDLRALRNTLTEYLAQHYPGYLLETKKQTMLSVDSPPSTPITQFCDDITAFVQTHFPSFAVTRSTTAVDISYATINKNEGLRTILRDAGVSYKEVCAIGDSINDLVVLREVGYPACPHNADEHVKTICRYVAKANFEDGVLEILSTL